MKDVECKYHIFVSAGLFWTTSIDFYIKVFFDADPVLRKSAKLRSSMFIANEILS